MTLVNDKVVEYAVGYLVADSLGNSAAFLPTDKTGIQLWLDGSDATKLYTDAAKTTPVSSDGDVIGAMEDKSGQGKDYTQTTAGAKPLYKTARINSLSTALFDGSNDALTGSLAIKDTKTIFIVGKFNTVPAATEFDSVITIKFDATNFSELMFVSIAGYEEISIRHDYMVAGNAVGIDLTLDTDPHVWSHTYNNGDNTSTASYTARIEDPVQTIVASGSFGRTGTDVSSIGGRIDSVGAVTGSVDMDIGEIIVYDSVLSAADQTNVRVYLINKWGT